MVDVREWRCLVSGVEVSSVGECRCSVCGSGGV